MTLTVFQRREKKEEEHAEEEQQRRRLPEEEVQYRQTPEGCSVYFESTRRRRIEYLAVCQSA